MNQFKAAVDWCSEKIDHRSQRERILIFITLAVALFIAWKIMFFNSIFGSKESIVKNTMALRDTINQLQGQISDISQNLRQDPIYDLREKVKAVTAQNLKLDQDINALRAQLIPPKQMANLLQDMLLQESGIELLKLENLQEKALFSKEELVSQTHIVEKYQVYSHPLEIEFRATYEDTKKFLMKLEKLPWKFIWEEFIYEVDKYPKGRVKIMMHTLSLHPHWISM